MKVVMKSDNDLHYDDAHDDYNDKDQRLGELCCFVVCGDRQHIAGAAKRLLR